MVKTVRRGLLVSLAVVAGAFGFVQGCGDGDRPGALGFSPGAPCTEGARMACHATLARREHSIDCYAGEQVCSGGSWSACGASGGTLATLSRESTKEEIASFQASPSHTGRGGRVDLQALSTPSADAGNCVDNPCNPECIGFTETPASALSPGLGNASTLGGNYTASSLLGGVLNVVGTLTGCGLGYGLLGGAGLSGIACNYDECCSAPIPLIVTYLGGVCKRYDDPTTSGALCNLSSCGRPDFTAPPGCTRAADSTKHLSICNRGNANATSGTLGVGIGPASLLNFLGGDLCATAPLLAGTSGHCLIDLTEAPILTDQCLDINFGTATTINGVVQPGVTCTDVDLSTNAVVYVNSGATLFPAADVPRIAECAGYPTCNNGSEIRPGEACVPYGTGSLTEVVDYTATCPAGHRPVWKYLSYRGSPSQIPDGGRVRFLARPYATQNDGGLTTLGDVSIVDLGAGSLATCDYNSPRAAGSDGGVCPVPIGDLIDAAHPVDVPSRSSKITLMMVLQGSSGTKPSLESWKLDYDCEPYE